MPKITEIFKLEEETFCGDIDFKFVPEASWHIDFNQDTLEFTLRPQLQDPPGTSINYSLQVFFVDYPDLVWRVPVSLTILQFSEEDLNSLRFETTMDMIIL